MIHKLPILPESFEAVKSGVKTAEIRKNDHGFKVGDLIALEEYKGNKYTGRKVIREITHITNLVAYAPGYVMLSMKSDIDLNAHLWKGEK